MKTKKLVTTQPAEIQAIETFICYINGHYDLYNDVWKCFGSKHLCEKIDFAEMQGYKYGAIIIWFYNQLSQSNKEQFLNYILTNKTY